jgi:hypothetical protein
MVEAAIAGEGFQLVLRVFGYERPHLESGADANWLIAEAELTVDPRGSYRAKESMTLRTEELAAFREQLRHLLEALDGEVTLGHMEQQVGCTVTLRRGKGEFSGFVRQHVGGELRVRGLPTDQSFLQESLRGFDKFVREFPIRGDALG